MWKTNIKVMMVGVCVIGFYTVVARIIPQLESEVPESIDLSSGVTPEALTSAGQTLYEGAGGCTACHGLGTRAPNLLTDHAGQGSMGQRCGSREPGVDCKTYLYNSMVDPASYVVDGFTPIMPDASRQLSNDQIWAIVAFLQSQGGDVTVTADDIGSSETAAGEGAAGGGTPGGGGGFSTTTDPRQLLTENACIACHAIDGAGPPIGPSFDGIGSRLSAAQIRESILDPNATVSEGFEQFAGTMPLTFGQQLSAQQLEAIVQFLAERRGS